MVANARATFLPHRKFKLVHVWNECFIVLGNYGWKMMCSVYAEVVNEIGLIVTAGRAFVFTVRASKYRNAESNGGERQRAAGRW